jgi:hypothetical protein
MLQSAYLGRMNMALKDLVAKRAALTEQQIEDLISEHVGFDADEKVVFPRPGFANLSNKAKVLIYLVALQGWPFITDDAVATDAAPAELEAALHIHGGTLRPTLKDLKDRHLVAARGRKYSVRAPTFEAIQKEIAASPRSGPRPPRTSPKKRKRRDADDTKGQVQAGAKKHNTSKGHAGDRSRRFDAWIREGFFDLPRTLADVRERFHEEADIVPSTSLPGYLLGAVKQGRLKRKKADVGGKQMWKYQTSKKSSD